jgi:hypothetical protein
MPFIIEVGRGQSGTFSVDWDQKTNVATTFHPYTVDFFEFNNIRGAIYRHDSALPVCEGVNVTGNAFVHVEGVVCGDNGHLTHAEVVDQLEAGMKPFGDYIAMKIDEQGDGWVDVPLMGFTPIFAFQTDLSTILSDDLGLFFSFVFSRSKNHPTTWMNLEFIRDSILNEWGARDVPQATIFRNVQRILPNERWRFERWQFRVEKQDSFKANHESLLLYTTNKNKFYDQIFGSLSEGLATILKNTNTKQIEILQSGGLDSRLSSCVLAPILISEAFDTKITHYGPDDHPDVIIGKRVASVLGINSESVVGGGGIWIPNSLEDYYRCIRVSMGEWNSNNWRTSRQFKGDIVVSGQDNFKRWTFEKVTGMNRWYAGRMRYTKALPVFSNPIINDVCKVYASLNEKNPHYEFAFELMRRFSPEMLDVPLVGMALPQLEVEPFSTISQSKSTPSIDAEAFFDRNVAVAFLSSFTQPPSRKITIELVESNKRLKRIIMDYAALSTRTFYNIEW